MSDRKEEKKITGLAGFGINYTLTHPPERSQGAEYLNNDYEQVPIYFRIAFAIIMLCAIRFALDNGYGIAAFVFAVLSIYEIIFAACM